MFRRALAFVTPVFSTLFSIGALLLLAATPAIAQLTNPVSPNIVISQVYGGGGNSGATYKNDFIELFNRGSTAVNVTGWSVQYASSAGTTWAATALSGTIQPGRYYLVQQAAGTNTLAAPLPLPEATGTIAMSATAGKVALVNTATLLSGTCPPSALIVDFVGYGTAANCSEGTAPTTTLSNTSAALRQANGCTDTGVNFADFATSSATPRNSASPVATCTVVPAPPNLSINSVSIVEGNSGTSLLTFNVSLSAPAPVGGVTFDIATANNTAVAPSDYIAQSLTGQTIATGNNSYTFSVVINGDTLVESDEKFVVNITNVTGAIVVAGQGIGTIVNDDVGLYRIHAVQGAGNTSPLVSQTVMVEGIVTSNLQVIPGSNQLSGFFIQEPDNLSDADPATSEGIFIFTSSSPVALAVGDMVRVMGTVFEFGTVPNSLTQITGPTVTILSSGNALPAVTEVSLPVPVGTDMERYEGMLVRIGQTLTVSNHSELARFGEIGLSANGRLMQPTNVVDPNDDPASGTTSVGNSNVAAVTDFADLNKRASIILDGSYRSNDPVIPFLDPSTNTIRLGTTIAELSGVLSQLGGTHRIYASVPPVFTYAPRPMSPPNVGGNVKVASANVLNYFNGNGLGGGFPTSRGADTLIEFNRQRAKIIAAINGLNVDVVGLLEIENDGTGANSAIQDLVNGLNAAAGAGTWSINADPPEYQPGPGTAFGTSDQIKPAIIYKSAVVTPVGPASTKISSAFAQGRAPVAQTFALVSNGEKFTLMMNHLKSKSSSGATGLDIDQGDGQAAFNNMRRLQANVVVAFANELAAINPNILVMGDINAYEQEDPMDILRAGGLSTIINNSYSYMFGGLSGSLDHALGNAALMAQVAGFGKWHINADEPVVLDYNVENKNTAGCTSSCTSPDYFAPTPFRSSDHDPVLVGLKLTATQSITFGALASKIFGDADFALNASASSGLTITFSSQTALVCAVSGVTVTIVSAGTCTLRASQSGNIDFAAASDVDQSFVIAQATQTITFDVLTDKTFGDADFVVNATASSTLPVVFASQTGSICTVAGNTVSLVAAGTCTVRASQAGNGNYAAASNVDQSFVIAQAAQTITLGSAPTIAVGGSGTVSATGGASGNVVVFSSNSAAVCTSAGANGSTITGVTAGTCVIAANQAGNTNYAAANEVTQAFAIDKGTQATLIATSALSSLPAGGNTTLSTTGGTGGGAVSYASNNGNCNVSGTTLTAVAVGTCTVTATKAADANYNAATATVNVVVTVGSQTIVFYVQPTVRIHTTGMVSASGGASGNPITFSSTTTRVCTVSGVNGSVVTGHSVGTCIIAANQAGNANYNAAPQVTQSFAVGPAGPARQAKANDFNGDGKSDLVWFNSANGETAYWFMDGRTKGQSGTWSTDANWRIAATGDLNGDGKVDLIWSNNATGETVYWLMNGATMIQNGTWMTHATWRVIATADLDGNGKADLIWFNSATGETAYWLMDGAIMVQSGSWMTHPTWIVVASGDFNGDDKADLVWHNSATGETAYWVMNGGIRVHSGTWLTHPNQKVVGTGNYSGGGKSDLVWYNSATGETSYWLMNGVNKAKTGSWRTHPTWKVIATGDYRGDGRSDLVWFNSATGETAYWLMKNEKQEQSGTWLTHPSWQVVGP